MTDCEWKRERQSTLRALLFYFALIGLQTATGIIATNVFVKVIYWLAEPQDILNALVADYAAIIAGLSIGATIAHQQIMKAHGMPQAGLVARGILFMNLAVYVYPLLAVLSGSLEIGMILAGTLMLRGVWLSSSTFFREMRALGNR